MEIEDVKKWLGRAKGVDYEIKCLKAERDKVFGKATQTVKPLQTDRVQASSGNNSENRFIEYAEYSTAITAQVNRLEKIKAEILRAINQVEDNRFRALLVGRYIRFERWENIENEINYSKRQVMRLHSEAIQAVADVLNGRKDGTKWH